jgi:serine/threonine protein kinase
MYHGTVHRIDLLGYAREGAGMENDPLIGQQLGAYYIQSKLGEGGMARVYKGYHTRLRRDVAIKIILSQIAEQEGFKARFEREAQLIASLQYPNIVAVYDFGDIGNLTYLVMQYVGGGTLRDQLRGGHALDPRQAILYCQQMARALHHAHLRGIVHRDVKPQNMLVSATDRNQLLLSDFGIAKLYDSRHEPTLLDLTGNTLKSDPSLTNVDQIVGTAEYMAPEQINGKPVDARTDVYALGVVLYQMLAGEVPFHSTTIQGLLFQHVYTLPRPMREMNSYVPEILDQITAKALAKAPEDRFQSAEAMAQALETANQYATNQLSSSLPGNLAKPAQGATTPLQNRPTVTPPSYYGSQPPAHSGAVATPQQPSNYGVTPPYGSSPPVTNPSGASLVRPTPPFRVGRVPISYIGIVLVLLLAIVLILVKQGIIPLPSSNPNNPSTVATPFTETFQNNDRHWTIGTINGLTANIVSPAYKLDVNSPTSETYFPHPNVGTLPGNFTLTVIMQQTAGDQSIFYGLAFRLREDGSNVFCYAFGINSTGQYQLLKYDPNASQRFSVLWTSSQPLPVIKKGLDQSNTLQAIVEGSTFSFRINGQMVPVGGSSSDTSYTDKDNPYTGGQLALFVGAKNENYLVTSVQLALP